MDGYIGEIRLFAGTFAPRNWQYCSGAILSVAEYSPLFSIISTQFGGDGRTNFKLPDLRGRVPVCTGAAPGLHSYSQGMIGGYEQVSLAAQQMPTHTHTATGTVSPKCNVSATGDMDSPEDTYLAKQSTDFYNETADGVMAPSDLTITVEATGGNSAHENRQPFMALNYIICVNGEYPDRP